MHSNNILFHIIAGSTALFSGTISILARKGSKVHRNAGQLFLVCLGIVILTGLLGIFIFGRNTFLLVITVLSGYSGYSGFRALKMRSGKPAVMDNLVAITALVVVCYFLWYFRSIGMIWSPVIIYSTVGYLLMMVTYDLARNFIRAKIGIYEHILKMVSAWSGLLSAFCGTVFPQYQPYSQFLPSISGTLIAIAMMMYWANKEKLRG
jgi:uncharacterized membrane protein